MNLQFGHNSGNFRCETFLIPMKTLLAQIESFPTKEGNDVDCDLDQQFIEDAPEHGRWGVWTCFVFGMRYILPKVVDINDKPMMIIRDLSPRRYLRASEEEREKSKALYQAITWYSHEPRSRSIFKCVPLPENIQDPQDVDLMLSEDGIVVREEVRHRKTCVSTAARLMRLVCRASQAAHSFTCSPSDELSPKNDRLTGFVRVVYSPRFILPNSSVNRCWVVGVVA